MAGGEGRGVAAIARGPEGKHLPGGGLHTNPVCTDNVVKF